MTLRIYNSLTRKKEIFKPVKKNEVRMYVCGMTVYSDAHIGHARTYYVFDVIRRYFEYKGYKVKYVQNVTDVDDKIIKAANERGIDALVYSRRFTERCLTDLERFGIRKADVYPKASETINDMIEMIKRIIENGYGYEAGGDVYFSVEKFREYGKLSGQNIDEMKVGARVEPGELKRSPLDFALWKKAKSNEPSWDSPWGKGRPGWHIECSTMSSKYLGLPFDIHGGGMDLRFPHHENEIAQAEAATGKKFVNYWVHVGLLTVEGEKMSKSLGNIINVKDIIKTWNPEIIRFFFAQSHYRSPPDFSEKALRNSERGLGRIHRLKEKLEKIVSSNSVLENLKKENLRSDEAEYLETIKEFERNFEEAMDDDFNTPKAVSLIFDFTSKSNSFLEKRSDPNVSLCKYALNTLIKLGNILTLFQEEKEKFNSSEKSYLLKKLGEILIKHDEKLKIDDLMNKDVEDLINMILDVREEARKKKEWETADAVRTSLEKLGFEIQDTNKGPVWRKKNLLNFF